MDMHAVVAEGLQETCFKDGGRRAGHLEVELDHPGNNALSHRRPSLYVTQMTYNGDGQKHVAAPSAHGSAGARVHS